MKAGDDLSINALASLTKLDRRTVVDRLAGLKPLRVVARAKRYALRDAIPALCQVPDSRGGTESQSRRLLNDSRRTLADLQAEAIRRERVPLDDAIQINEAALSNVAGILKSRLGKTLDDQSLADCFAELANIGTQITALGPNAPTPLTTKKPRKKRTTFADPKP
jgi:hypothetical protein